MALGEGIRKPAVEATETETQVPSALRIQSLSSVESVGRFYPDLSPLCPLGSSPSMASCVLLARSSQGSLLTGEPEQTGRPPLCPTRWMSSRSPSPETAPRQGLTSWGRAGTSMLTGPRVHSPLPSPGSWQTPLRHKQLEANLGRESSRNRDRPGRCSPQTQPAICTHDLSEHLSCLQASLAHRGCPGRGLCPASPPPSPFTIQTFLQTHRPLVPQGLCTCWALLRSVSCALNKNHLTPPPLGGLPDGAPSSVGSPSPVKRAPVGRDPSTALSSYRALSQFTHLFLELPVGSLPTCCLHSLRGQRPRLSYGSVFSAPGLQCCSNTLAQEEVNQAQVMCPPLARRHCTQTRVGHGPSLQAPTIFGK